MKTIKYYWKRFVSNTPGALKKLQGLLVAVAASSGAALAIMTQYGITEPWLLSLLKYTLVAATFAVPMLQFATTDTKLQKTEVK